jgi:hypothetical protein
MKGFSAGTVVLSVAYVIAAADKASAPKIASFFIILSLESNRDYHEEGEVR